MTDKVEVANMKLEKRSYTSKHPSTAARNTNPNIVVDIMVAVNISPIELYTEIILLVPGMKEQEKTKKPTTAVIDAPAEKPQAAKKARTS